MSNSELTHNKEQIDFRAYPGVDYDVEDLMLVDGVIDAPIPELHPNLEHLEPQAVHVVRSALRKPGHEGYHTLVHDGHEVLIEKGNIIAQSNGNGSSVGERLSTAAGKLKRTPGINRFIKDKS